MGYFQDTGVLLLYCMTALFWISADRKFIFALLYALVLLCGEYVLEHRMTKILGCVAFVGTSILIPELVVFYPVMGYALLKEKSRVAALTSMITGGVILTENTYLQNGMLLNVAFGCLLAVLLERKTKKYDKLDREFRKTIDDGEEKTLLLAEKNRALIEKQNYEIYAATLRERNRIAREIHDNVGHVLSRTILLTGAAKALNKDQNLEPILDGLDDSLNSAMDSIRSSVHDLHDEAVNLQESIKGIIRDFKYCKVELKYDASDKMDSNTKYCYACVVKEALSNIMKYSGATYVKITVREHPALYQLCVEDNGRGGTGNMDKNTGIGLKNMQDRVQALNGTLRIEGEKGFRIFAMIPKEMP